MVWPSGASRYALTWFSGSLPSTTLASTSRSITGRLDGTTNEYVSTCPSPGARPLPPVSTPLNFPVDPSPTGTRPRRVTGTLTGPPPAGPVLNSIVPLGSPAPAGTTADTRTVFDAPGASVSDDGETDPKPAVRATDAPKRTFPTVPPAVDVSLKISAVHVPAAGCSTCALPKPSTPCGSECAA